LGDVDLAPLAHPLFAFLLFFEKFAFAGHVAAVAFGEHVLAQRLSKRLARSVTLVEEEAPAAPARPAMTGEAGVDRRGGLLGQPLPPQLLHADTDCLEIISCLRP